MDTLIILNFGIIDNLFLILAFYVSYLNIEKYVNDYLDLSLSHFLIGVITWASLDSAPFIDNFRIYFFVFLVFSFYSKKRN